jgi:hypothetical protein
VTLALVICVSQVAQASGAAEAGTSSVNSRAQDLTARVPAPERCQSARKAVAYYRAHTHQRQSARGGELADRTPVVRGRSCHWARYAAGVWVSRAKAALKALRAWEYEWAYEKWMPAWMIRLGQCEMALDWARRWGIYEGAFAFATSTWDGYKLPGYPASAADATPRQQMMVVLRIARKLTVGIPWGCWRGPQHAWVRGGLPERGFYGG